MNASRREFLTTLAISGATVGLMGGIPSADAGESGALIQWMSWHDGLQKATAEKKGIGLLIYADWCPHCRELQPVFRDAETVRASRGIVMIRQNADESPPWLRERFGPYGTYVPRLFFLHPDGTLATEIQSGNSRYPYFYQPQQGDAMRASMRRAAALAQKK